MNLAKIIFLVILTFPLLAHAEQTESERFLSNLLTSAVAQINAATPQVLDNDTRLEYTATHSNVIIYNNTMYNYTASDIELAIFEPFIEKNIITPLCMNDALTIFVELGVIMVYRYHGKHGRYIAEFEKDMATCR